MYPDEEQEQMQTLAQMNLLIERTANALRAAGDSRESMIAAIRPFLAEGMEISDSPSALWEYFAIVLRQAGFDHVQLDRRFRIYSTVTQEVFHGGQPYPADWPWHEHDEA